MNFQSVKKCHSFKADCLITIKINKIIKDNASTVIHLMEKNIHTFFCHPDYFAVLQEIFFIHSAGISRKFKDVNEYLITMKKL